MKSITLSAFIPPALLFCIGMVGVQSSEAETTGEMDKYRRLTLQHQLDYEVPLGQVTVVSSHNTYNATDWGYPYPNHQKDLLDQLNAGIRGVNFDVHSIFQFFGGYSEKLCHFAGTSSLFCRPEKSVSFGTGLNQLNHWLNNNPGEVVILVIEDYIKKGKRHEEAAGDIQKIIGSKVYRPDSSGCQRLPLATLTKQHVLDAGKQLIIATTEDCAHTNSNWRSWVWDIKQTPYKGDEYKDGDLTRREDHWSIVAEDRSIMGGGDAGYADLNVNQLSGGEIAEAMLKGAGVIALDMILKSNRHEDAIWSWRANEPKSDVGNEDCAAQSDNSKWQALNCNSSYRYACQDPLSGDWALSDNAGSWSNGDNACQSLGDGDFIFSMPVNARENAVLNDQRAAAGVNTVWLNYNDQAEEGKWVANHRYNWRSPELEMISLIKARNNNSKCLHKKYANTENGNPIHLWDNCNVDDLNRNDEWIYDASTGLIKSAQNLSKCLHKKDDNWNNGNIIHLYDCDKGSADNKTWVYDENSRYLRAKNNNAKCIHKRDGNWDNGNIIHLWDCSAGSSDNKTWILEDSV